MTNILLQAKEVSSIKPRGFGKKAFRLQGINFILPNGYIMGIVDEEKFLAHVYYGEKLSDHRAGYLLRTQEGPFVPSVNNRDRIAFS